MGIMKSKVTRRAAIATGAVGLASLPLVMLSLRKKHGTSLPEVAQPFATARVRGSGKMSIDGYTLEVPPIEMDILKPSDWDTYRSRCEEAARTAFANDPGYKAHLQRQAAARKEEREKEAKERSPVSAPQRLEPSEADIQRFNTKIDNDDTLDAANKELIKKAYREALERSFEKARAKMGQP